MKAALAHPNGAKLSDREIAKHIGVAISTIGDWRKKFGLSLGNLKIDTRTVTRNGTTYQQNTANIGRRVDSPTKRLGFSLPADAELKR